MMNNLLKNICLIGFALIFPITLPAGGIQNNSEDLITPNNSREIILNSKCVLYSFPQKNAKQLETLNVGSNLSILSKWSCNERGDVWARVELATNILIGDPNRIKKGWIKM